MYHLMDIDGYRVITEYLNILKMDWLAIITAVIIAIVIVLNVLIFLINNYIYPTINPSNDVIINSGTSHNGNNGNDGSDGINGTEALNGADGENGIAGINGRAGQVGAQGEAGPDASSGSQGLLGNPGVVGAQGLPSNSQVTILTRYDITNTDSYSMIDAFSFEGIQYQVSMYANVENNSRFVLKFGEDIIVPQTGFLTNISPETLPATTLDAGSFYSNLRIAIGYGRGNTNSKNRSDDVIFYVSPPISRRSFLFRYRLPATVPTDYEYLSIKFPIKPLNNTKDFYFFDSAVPESVPLDHELTLWKYHLFKGLAKYELVVNTFPPLPGSYNFNYRIIEEFTRNDSSDFALPQIIYPFNASVLNYKQNGLTKLTVSNRFDLNRVILRDYNTDKIAWTQTNKRTVEIVTGEKEPLVPYDYTYQGLKMDDQISQTALFQPQYYEENSTTPPLKGIPALMADGYALSLRGTFKQDTIVSNLQVYFGMRNYVPKVPLDKFKNLEKFYLKFMLFPNAFPNSDDEVTFTYGEEFSFDLIDFQTVYAKSIFVSTANLTTTDGSGVITSFNPVTDPLRSRQYLVTDIARGVEVGYTKYSTKDRYTTTVLFQKKNDYCYYFNIPLYGYKKR